MFLFIHNITEEENIANIRRQFSANVSHELKTPLTSIMGASELLSNNMVKQEDVVYFSEKIYSEATRLLKLVQDVIKVSRLDEQSKFEFETVDLTEITNKVMSHLQDKVRSKEITVTLHSVPAKVNGVDTVLYEMLYNLYDNAISYNKNHGEILIDIRKENNNVVWQIKDSGVGIDSVHLPKIFERFYRVDASHSKDTGGTGLGLSIVKNGANLHNAKLDLQSEPNVGTTITLEFLAKQ